MKLLVILLTCTLFFSFQTSVFADESSHRKAAEELLIVCNSPSMMEQTAEKMVTIQLQQNPELGPYKKVMLKFFNKYVGWESTKEDLISLYVESFTEGELKQISAFYETDVGKKTISQMPIILQKSMEIGAAKVKANISVLQSMLAEESKRIQELQNKQGQN